MISKKRIYLIGIISIFSIFNSIKAQETYEGYTLFLSPRDSGPTLIGMDKEIVKTWKTQNGGGYVAHMLDNGVILTTERSPNGWQGGGSHGIINKLSFDGEVLWRYEYANEKHCAHHDIDAMPNGNVLIIAWEMKSAEEATQAGREKEGEIWPTQIVEVKQTGETTGKIVWEWNAWDHLVQDYDSKKDNYGTVADHPELIDINSKGKTAERPGADWLHINGIDYNEDLDQIVISSHFSNEFYVIDHSTSSKEASSHSGGKRGKGGDILYRWGNPQNYGRGTTDDQKIYVIHDAHWADSDGKGKYDFMIYNNGNRRPDGNYSSIEIITAPVDDDGNYDIESDAPFGPEEQTWIYMAPNQSDFFSNHLGSAQKLPNGNVLICEATKGHFFEINEDKEIVWEYDCLNERQPNSVPQCHRYPYEQVGTMIDKLTYKKNNAIKNYPNPFCNETNISFSNLKNKAQIKIFAFNGREIISKTVRQDNYKWNAVNEASGVYLVYVKIEDKVLSKYINLIK